MEMNESILNHLFLPHYLPSSADDDFLIQNNHQYEHKILECMEVYLNSFQSTDTKTALPIFRILANCVKRWSVLQDPQTISASSLQDAIKELPSGCFLPLYFHAQNAAILIEIDKNNSNEPLISSWQVLLPAEEITSSLVPCVSCFPVRTYKLNDRSQLISKAHCELLVDFMVNTIEYSKTYKDLRKVDETRDVPESHYVCQWWVQQFQGIKTESNSNKSCQFTKKHRDQIRWNNAALPFRRSGLWMTIKVVFHTILTKHLGHIGTVVYKLLITHFLTYIIHTGKRSADYKISTDLLVHCIRKIVRRLNKIECLLTSIETNDVNEWIHRTKQQIELQVDALFPELNWQNIIKMKEETSSKVSMNSLKLDQSEIYQHSCLKVKAYLNSRRSSETSELSSDADSHDNRANVNQVDYIPSIEELTKNFDYTIGIALTRMEIWVESSLEQWVNRPSVLENETNRFEILLRFYEEYQSTVLNYCWPKKGPTDPIGYSRFILTSLTIIHVMHGKLCTDPRFERLALHSIDIPNLVNLFEFLVLPTREDMIRARDLYDYFHQFNNKSYPDLLNNIESANAFGVYYASQSSTMTESIQQIRAEADGVKQQKIQEVKNEKEKYVRLMKSISDLSCECDNTHGYRHICEKCSIQQQVKNIEVNIYECPLPSRRESALAVIFELQMPIEIRCYRDIIWQFVNRPSPQPENDMYEWLTVPPHEDKLKSFNAAPSNCKVKLVSYTKSITQSHYLYPPSFAYTSIDGFLFENSLKVQISPIDPIAFKDECRILTPQLDHTDYKHLQFTINTTQFVQNHVIAQLSDCPLRLTPTQCIEFGSFRSGHRLQWWNLLAIFEMDSLSIAEESVAILIIHSILQYGPVKSDSGTLSNSWCPESHEQLLKDHFIDELIARLDRRLDDCELNWQNELVLVVITMITMRMFTLCNSTRESLIADFIMKCRRIGEKWIDLISENIQSISSVAVNAMEKLRLKMILIGISCLLTFSTQSDRIHCLLSSNEHVVSLLKAATTVRDNIILNKNQTKKSNINTFTRNIIRFSERVLVMVQPTIAEFLRKTSYQSLNEFATVYWTAFKTKGIMNEQWEKRNEDIYDGCYYCRYESGSISIDCVKGTFLVNGMTTGFLAEDITSNELFVRVFGQHVFEVQAAESSNTYITKHLSHDDGRIQYEFHFNDQTECLTIAERHIQTNEVFELIPHHCFETELPDMFVSNYSHWWNKKDQTVEFRPVQFNDTDFLNKKPYMLLMKAGYIITTETVDTQILVNQSSAFFESLFNRYFIRLDDKPYVYMMRDDASHFIQQPLDDIIIHIYLSRLRIAFKYNPNSGIITSREYSDMCIQENQWLGTLTGLTSGLLLAPLPVNNHRLPHYPYRKLIVPFGEIHGTGISYNNHQTVIIQRKSSLKQFLRHYSVFILNDRLNILQSTDSPTGWLYLALLHAMTSHSLPDQYTGMTGMERAFQLLNSAGCWSDQPFDALSLNILSQIAAISPKATYYPEDLTCMVTIEWNPNSLPYSMQHFGYYLLAKKLIDVSQQFAFMYPSLTTNKTPEIFERKLYNEKLLKKLYWDYRDSYNLIARLSVEMEIDIVRTGLAVLHPSTSEHCSHVTNYTAVHLVNDLYNKGNVNLIDCSQQHWLPLSQWMTNENQLKTIWIGLLKLTDCLKKSITKNNRDGIDRFETLIDFLHYISSKLHINSFYLQMLKTALKIPTQMSTFVTFPSFIEYSNIEEISFITERIKLPSSYSPDKRNEIIAKAESCFLSASTYEMKTKKKVTISTETTQINRLLTSWQNNKKLRSFLEFVQSQICSIAIEQFHIKLSYYPQQFTTQSIEEHHKIQVKSTDILIDQKLLRKADQKFHRLYSGYFNKQTVTPSSENRLNEFPQDIFSSTNDHENPLSEINNYFKNQLAQSWNKLLSDKQIEKENPLIEEIIKLLHSCQEESRQLWNELVENIMVANAQLFEVGLISRITPTTLISYFQQKVEKLALTTDQPTLLGGILVYWTLEQQLERALHYAIHDKWEDFTKEISNTPHSNWIPSDHVSWLILELEMNITIREIQIKVASHMMKPNMATDDTTIKNVVMQMNMGEGKTSVILPMLALSLSTSSSLVRIVLLKSLFSTNYQSLKSKLGGLLNRRIFPFACRRDRNFNNKQINQISARLEQGLYNYDIILTSQEDILSFDLLTINKCRRNEFNTTRSMLTLQRSLRKYTRDVLDESDEILHVKYQLIYTAGNQQQVDGGVERWKTVQSILNLVKKHAQAISNRFTEEVCYKPSERKSSFPHFRLHSHRSFSLLCENIANDWLSQKLYRYEDKKIILSFILESNSSVEHLADQFSPLDIQLFLIVRGLLSSEVLLIALKKRYRVNYGINPNPYFNRLMAVPFRAKDIVADRTEFGQPDVALVLTQLSYYYSGLNDTQMTQCLNRLNKESNPTLIYDQWISYEDEDHVPINIKQWKGINLNDYQQRTFFVFPILRKNILVIDYFLNHFVFPREAKQFPHKLVSSAWDLSSSVRSKIITGFSGTSDTQLLLPVHIRQCDLHELQKTDAIVVNNLLQPENESYQSLPINATSDEILDQILNYREMINVILDVGALFIDGNNRDIAVKWLNLSDQNHIDYAVYFEFDSIVVCDRQFHHQRFDISPASQRLDHCIFYLDEIHTRGTDFKFPNEFIAAVTLGNGLTKDRFVQAAMRMRKLGNGHSLAFWSSNEVQQQIITLKKNSFHHISLIDILRWVYENTVQSTWEGLHLWSAQSLSFQRKMSAFRTINWENDQQLFTDIMMKELARDCLEPEMIKLTHMYGTPKVLQTTYEIYCARYKQTDHHISREIHNAVVKRLQDYGGLKQRLSQFSDEEQQRELEQELEEERQLTRLPSVTPSKPTLHEQIKNLSDTQGVIFDLAQFSNVFRRLAYAFTDTTFSNDCQPHSWQRNLWVSTEFQRVILTKGESLNPFLRPPRWIVVYRNQHIIFISPFEANWLIDHLQSNRSPITTLRLLLPRAKQTQSIFVNTPTLTIPPLITPSDDAAVYFIPIEQLVQLFVFNGTLYFETVAEQTTYCHCLSLCPKPRTDAEEKAFEENWITVDGFVEKPEHHCHLQIHQARFNFNPLAFVRQLIKTRNNSDASITSHVGSIILNAHKLM